MPRTMTNTINIATKKSNMDWQWLHQEISNGEIEILCVNAKYKTVLMQLLC